MVAYGIGPVLLIPLGLSPVVHGLAMGALSGVAGIVGFLAAMGLRIRPLSAFGVRGTTFRWILLGIGGGILAFVLSRAIGLVMYALGIQPENIQATYTEGGSGGVWSLTLSLVFLALQTPLGELVFRGVVTSALLRYGAVIAVIGSAVIFALMHGLNAIFLTALSASSPVNSGAAADRSGPGSSPTPSTTRSARA